MKKTEYKMIIENIRNCHDRDKVLSKLTRVVPKICTDFEITDGDALDFLKRISEIERKFEMTFEEQEQIDRACMAMMCSVFGSEVAEIR